MPRCHGSKPNGSPCGRIVKVSEMFCYAHDPNRRGERQRNAAKAGRSRSDKEIVEVRALLRKLTDGTLEGQVPTAVAAVVNQILNTRLRAIEVGRKLGEQQELLDRLEALQEHAQLVGGSRRA